MANEVKVDKINISVAYRQSGAAAMVNSVFLEKTHMSVAIRYVAPPTTKARRVRAVRYF